MHLLICANAQGEHKNEKIHLSCHFICHRLN